MGFFNKKEKVPEIPPAPTLPELPKTQEVKRDLPELPSFPSNNSNKNLNQEMVKSAVNDTSEVNEVTVDVPKEHHVEEVPNGGVLPPRPSKQELPELPKRTLELTPSIKDKPTTKQIEPIFVRIDKFQTAQKGFEEVREKIKEIESVLRKVKDLKTKEDEEISEWSQEIEKIKARLSEIDENIFSEI